MAPPMNTNASLQAAGALSPCVKGLGPPNRQLVQIRFDLDDAIGIGAGVGSREAGPMAFIYSPTNFARIQLRHYDDCKMCGRVFWADSTR